MEEQYKVSARKYRPQKFEEVVGQEHVTTTLKNAITSNQLAQAFLFCGPRGVGKTTCARILAKVINAPDPVKAVQDGSYADMDLEIALNIFELDAASNNSVDDIRHLVEQVRFAPQAGKYKVYIIDEVHMLSQAAFNAFLKTLEEPPPYAIFILATTEKHKILPTILSRCQIFNFRQIGVAAIVGHLRSICEQEGIEAEEAALHLIAQKADGALRDALSIFDQIASFSNKKIEYTKVLESLNVLDYDYYFKITDALLAQDEVESMVILDDIIKKGFDGGLFLSGLAQHFRDLLFAQSARTTDILDYSEPIKQRYAQQATIAPAGFLLSGLNITNQFALNHRTSQSKRLQIELALLKLAYLPAIVKAGGIPTIATTEKKNSAPPPVKPVKKIEAQPVIKPKVEEEELPGQQKMELAQEPTVVEIKEIAKAKEATEDISLKKKASPPPTADADISLKKKASPSPNADADIQLKKKPSPPSTADADIQLKKKPSPPPTADADIQLKKKASSPSTADADIQLKKKVAPKEETTISINEEISALKETVNTEEPKVEQPKKPVLKPKPVPQSSGDNSGNGIQIPKKGSPVSATSKGPVLFSLDEIEAQERERAANTVIHDSPEAAGLTFEKLKEEWLDFAENQETNRAKESFRNNLPSLEGDMITVEVSNVLDAPLLKKIGANLIKFLKDKYSIKDLHLTVEKIASTSQFEKPKSESAEDRVKKMIAENPAFSDFVKRFELEIDY